MGRSSGYRARKGNEEEVAELRALLAECRSDQWQRASAIMSHIVTLTGSRTGPSGGSVEPRACKYCSYYGHTRQHCQKRQRDEEAEMEREKLRFEQEREERRKEAIPKEMPWYQRATQADWFDELGVPWYRDKFLGPMPTQEGGEGKWVIHGCTVKIAVE